MISVKDVSIDRNSYNGTISVLRNVSAEFRHGVNVLYGVPGSGKTTFLETLAGVESPASGKITVEGNVIFLAQVPERQFMHTTCRGELAAEDTSPARLKKVLEEMGLDEDILPVSPWSLSNGEKKRLTLARLILNSERGEGGSNFLMDDPFSNMDKKGIETTIGMVFKKGGYRVIMSTGSMSDTDVLGKSGIDFRLYRLEKGGLFG
ncbi:MAG: ATP-binding cassette domain-containing protein [Elusimicrobia bacterium]|nr:ATP-binding cassette domain-containing protein [Elusimicrobiota bacterium]